MSTPMETSNMSLPGPTQASTSTAQTQYPPLNDTHNDSLYSKLSSYKDFIRFIPEFDATSNTCSLLNFLSYCGSAKKYVQTVDEHDIVSLLRSKCKGRAGDCSAANLPGRIDDLIINLRQSFTKSKPPLTWIYEFETLQQEDQETVLAYYNRVNSHLMENIQAIKHSTYTDKAGFETLARDVAAEQFRKGLLEIYSRHMSWKRQPDIRQIYNEAVEIEKEVQSVRTKAQKSSTCLPIQNTNYQNTNYQKPNTKNYNNQNNTKPLAPNFNKQQVKFCNYCKKNNHNIEDCFAKAKNERNQNNRNITCQYCKKPGHSINECRRRAYNKGKLDAQHNFRNSGNGPSTPRQNSSQGPNTETRQMQ